MMVPNKILFPTDFSVNADNCLPFIREIANRAGSELYLLHVFHHRMLNPSTPPSEFEEKARQKQEEACAKLTTLSEELTRHHSVPVKNCKTEVRVGFPDDEILEVINEQNIDLVVMGTKGATDLSRIILGSTTSEVINDATCPVLAIPENATFEGLSHLVFATDLNAKDIPLIDYAAEFAKMFNAELTVLHIQEKETSSIAEKIETFKENLQNHVRYEKLRFHNLYFKGRVAGIDKFLKDNSAELLTMVTYKRNLFESLFKRSFTKRIAHQTRIPLLAFHEGHKPSR